MNNAELFKKVFGIYAEEFWAYPGEKMLDWLNSNISDRNDGDTINRQDAIDAVRQHKANVLGERKWDEGIAYGYEAAHEHICEVLAVLPSAQPDYDLSGYSDRLWKAAYERGKAEAQRTGRWIVVSDGYGNGEATACICECSECKDTIWVYKKSDRKWKYCPNCGAKMEEQE